MGLHPLGKSFWLDNAISPGMHTLIDLGYLDDHATQKRCEKLLELVSKKNFSVVGFNRLLVRIPKTKVGNVLDKIPAIKTSEEAPGYCWCTHTWLD